MSDIRYSLRLLVRNPVFWRDIKYFGPARAARISSCTRRFRSSRSARA